MATSTTNINSRIFLSIFVALKEGVFMFQKKYPFVIIFQRSFHNSAFEVLGEVYAGLLGGVIGGHLLHVMSHHQLH